MDDILSQGEIDALMSGLNEEYVSFLNKINFEDIPKDNEFYIYYSSPDALKRKEWEFYMGDNGKIYILDNYFTGEDARFPRYWKYTSCCAVSKYLRQNNIPIEKTSMHKCFCGQESFYLVYKGLSQLDIECSHCGKIMRLLN